MHHTNHQKKRLFVTAVLTAALAACGGGGSDAADPANNNNNPPDDNGSPTSQTDTINGVVADGYLTGASVCLDKNENDECDEAGIYRTKTVDKGVYELREIPVAEIGKYNIIVEVPEDAIDSDTGQPVGTAFKLAAPAGKPEFVSPLSTMVKLKVEQAPGMSADDAEELVKRDLQLDDVDLFEDYVAKKADQSDPGAAQYKQAHQLAQVTVKFLQQNVAPLTEQGVSDRDATMAAIEDLIARLDQVKQRLEEQPLESGHELNLGDVGLDPDSVKQRLDKETIEQKAERRNKLAQLQLEAVDAEDVLEQGLYWLEMDADHNGLPENFRVAKVGHGDGSLNEMMKTSHDGGYAWADKPSSHQELVLTADGWKLVGDDADNYDIIEKSDHRLALRHAQTEHSEQLFFAEQALAGQTIVEVLKTLPLDHGTEKLLQWLQQQQVQQAFSDQARAQVVTFTNAGAAVYELNYRSSCESQQLEETLKGNCAAVRVDEQPLAQLDDLKGATVALGDQLSVMFKTGDEHQAELMLQREDGTESLTVDYRIETVHDAEILRLTIPEKWRHYTWQGKDVIFAVHDGWVRPGSVRRAGETEPVTHFNQHAIADLMAAAGRTTPFPLPMDAGDDDDHQDDAADDKDKHDDPEPTLTEQQAIKESKAMLNSLRNMAYRLDSDSDDWDPGFVYQQVNQTQQMIEQDMADLVISGVAAPVEMMESVLQALHSDLETGTVLDTSEACVIVDAGAEAVCQWRGYDHEGRWSVHQMTLMKEDELLYRWQHGLTGYGDQDHSQTGESDVTIVQWNEDTAQYDAQLDGNTELLSEPAAQQGEIAVGADVRTKTRSLVIEGGFLPRVYLGEDADVASYHVNLQIDQQRTEDAVVELSGKVGAQAPDGDSVAELAIKQGTRMQASSDGLDSIALHIMARSGDAQLEGELKLAEFHEVTSEEHHVESYRTSDGGWIRSSYGETSKMLLPGKVSFSGDVTNHALASSPVLSGELSYQMMADGDMETVGHTLQFVGKAVDYQADPEAHYQVMLSIAQSGEDKPVSVELVIDSPQNPTVTVYGVKDDPDSLMLKTDSVTATDGTIYLGNPEDGKVIGQYDDEEVKFTDGSFYSFM